MSVTSSPSSLFVRFCGFLFTCCTCGNRRSLQLTIGADKGGILVCGGKPFSAQRYVLGSPVIIPKAPIKLNTAVPLQHCHSVGILDQKYIMPSWLCLHVVQKFPLKAAHYNPQLEARYCKCPGSLNLTFILLGLRLINWRLLALRLLGLATGLQLVKTLCMIVLNYL
jgi:hypothetical protein